MIFNREVECKRNNPKAQSLDTPGYLSLSRYKYNSRVTIFSIKIHYIHSSVFSDKLIKSKQNSEIKRKLKHVHRNRRIVMNYISNRKITHDNVKY